MSGNWKEGQESELSLADQEPATFEIWTHWLYTREVVLEDEVPTFTDSPKSTVWMHQLARVYVLAHYLLDRSFQNAVVDKVISLYLERCPLPGAKFISHIWPVTPDNCAMKRLILRIYAREANRAGLLATLSEMPANFLTDLLLEVVEGRKEEGLLPGPSVFTRGHYHDHDEKTLYMPSCAKSWGKRAFPET